MLDLRAISRDPEPALAALARRKDGSDERLRAALAARERLNAIRPELQAAQAERNAGAKAIGEAKRTGADASRGDRRDAGGERAREGARARGDAPRGGAPPARDDAAEPARPVRRRRGHRPQRVGLVRSRRQGPPRAGRRDDRHGGGLQDVGLALRLPQGRPRVPGAGARALDDGEAARARVRARHPAGAGQGRGAVRHRFPAGHRAADLPPGRRSAVPHGHVRGAARVAARGPDHGRGAAPLRRLLALLPA